NWLWQCVAFDKGWIRRIGWSGDIATPVIGGVRGDAEVAFAEDNADAVGSAIFHRSRACVRQSGAQCVGGGLNAAERIHTFGGGIRQRTENGDEGKHDDDLKKRECAAHGVLMIFRWRFPSPTGAPARTVV